MATLFGRNKQKKNLTNIIHQQGKCRVYTIGAPQFDIFFQEKFHQSREEFCLEQKLNPNLPIIVYALGSPNFLQEHHGAIEFAKRVAQRRFRKSSDDRQTASDSR